MAPYPIKYLAVLAVVLMALSDWTYAIKGGQKGDPCDFTGMALVVGANNEILCTGIKIKLKVIFPVKCDLILRAAKDLEGYEIKSDGWRWKYSKGESLKVLSAAKPIGMFNVDLTGRPNEKDPSWDPKSCAQIGASLYDGKEELDLTSCKLGGFGTDSNGAGKFHKDNLKSASVTKSLSAPCCSAVMETLTDKEKGIGMLSVDHGLNCVKVAGTPCGLGDLGAPVTCQAKSGIRVTIGLVASSPCVNNGLFLIHDLTGNSPKTKLPL